MKRLEFFYVLNTLWYVLSATRTERLLLDNPSVTEDRLSRLENTIAILNSAVHHLTSENKHLTTENIQQATTMQHMTNSLQQMSNSLQQITTSNHQLTAQYQEQLTITKQLQTTIATRDYGTTYVRWTRKQCPNNNTELVYSGFTAGGHYGQEGSSVEAVCLPPDPDFGKTSGPDYGRIYGAEFETDFFASGGTAEDLPCALCRVKHASSVIMIPGKNRCYPGWNLEYHGYLAANYHIYKAAGTYVCIDSNPEFLTGGSVDNDGKLFFNVLAKCGSLQCPPYKNNYPLTCVVCSK